MKNNGGGGGGTNVVTRTLWVGTHLWKACCPGGWGRGWAWRVGGGGGWGSSPHPRTHTPGTRTAGRSYMWAGQGLIVQYTLNINPTPFKISPVQTHSTCTVQCTIHFVICDTNFFANFFNKVIPYSWISSCGFTGFPLKLRKFCLLMPTHPNIGSDPLFETNAISSKQIFNI